MSNGMRKGTLRVWIVAFVLFVTSLCGISEGAAAGGKTLKGVWEYGSGLITVVFRDNGEFFSFNTFPASRGYRDPHRYTDDGHAFTIFFENEEDPSIEEQERCEYTLENNGDRLVLLSRTKSRYVNGRMEWSDAPEKENIILKRNNLYENVGNSRPAELGGYWEGLGGLAYIRFRDDGMYDISPATLPGGHDEQETYRYTCDGQSFTLYFAGKTFPSEEYRYTYSYTIEDRGNTLIITTMTQERYENGILQWSGSPSEEHLILFRTDSVTDESAHSIQSGRETGAPVTTGFTPERADTGSDSDSDDEMVPIEWYPEPEIAYSTPEPLSQEETREVVQIYSGFESFMNYWSNNRLEELLAFCAPSWLEGESDPKAGLFALIANRTPLNWSGRSLENTENDDGRIVVFQCMIDRNNGTDPILAEMRVLMRREKGQWYVDPRSLSTYTAYPNPEEDARTTEPTMITSEQYLYYNPEGGTMYHLDPNCKIIHQKYLPLQGRFLFSQINEVPYRELQPCQVCGAPLRTLP